jgi:ubiquinone/menaquinone biosynthesis C-methylase UbiE
MSDRGHWDRVYETKGSSTVSWYQPHLERSLELIGRAGLRPDARIIDIGGGASTLVDDLLDRGFGNITVVDLSERALALSRERLGAKGEGVTWLAGDITQVELPCEAYDLWHDRAVFHFLGDEASRAAYVTRVCASVKRGGHVVLATFGPKGPEQCSGLPVTRYSPAALHAAFGAPFELEAHFEEQHQTPWGALQEFVYCWCVLRPDHAHAP